MKKSKKPANTIYLLIKAVYGEVNLEVYTYRYKTLKEATAQIREKYKSYDDDDKEDLNDSGASVSMASDATSFSTINPNEYTAEEWKIVEVDLDNPLED